MGFLKSFQTQQVQAQYEQNKEIELENSNSGFIVVRHFLAYVHSPQSPNRVKVEASTKLPIFLHLDFGSNELLHNIFKIQTS